jgi:hypothetical protein
MTKEERSEIQSEVIAARDEARANVAALKGAIEMHLQNLHEAEHCLLHFLNDPLSEPRA